MGAQSGGEWAQVAETRAKLDNARWELDQTTVYAPSNGTAVNVNLRPGAMTVPIPAFPALTFVEDEFVVVAMYKQNELWAVAPGDEAEITLDTNPGTVIKAQVDSIVWSQSQGLSTNAVPTTVGPVPPPGKFPVKLKVDPKHKDLFLAQGARGDAAIYTEHLEMIILRKVSRVGTTRLPDPEASLVKHGLSSAWRSPYAVASCRYRRLPTETVNRRPCRTQSCEVLRHSAGREHVEQLLAPQDRSSAVAGR